MMRIVEEALSYNLLYISFNVGNAQILYQQQNHQQVEILVKTHAPNVYCSILMVGFAYTNHPLLFKNAGFLHSALDKIGALSSEVMQQKLLRIIYTPI